MFDDKLLELAAEEYEKTNDCEILRIMDEYKVEYGKQLEVLKRCKLKTFEQYYYDFLKLHGRLN